MIVDYCEFPDDLYYDIDTNTWVRIENSGSVVIGVTSFLASLAGKLSSVNLKPIDTVVAKGRSLATLESYKFVGPVPSPFSGRILAVNRTVKEKPRIVNDFPYSEGWIARLAPSNLLLDKRSLKNSKDAAPHLKEMIERFKVRCFKVMPDHELVEVGTECAVVLVHLNDLMRRITEGEIVHVVSDDPTAYVEMVRWTDQTRHVLVDWRREGGGSLYHFLVRRSLNHTPMNSRPI